MNGHCSEGRSNANRLMGFLGGFLSGGLVGAGAMLLLAPRAGKRTRSKIQHKGMKLGHQAAESLEDALAEAGDKAHEFTDDVHKEVGELLQRAQEVLTEGRK
jgi:gas vesicle protein